MREQVPQLEDLRPRVFFDDWVIELVNGVPQLVVTAPLRPERKAQQRRKERGL